MEKNLLYIMLHKACNCACDNCCTDSDPECSERLDYKVVKAFIDSTMEDKSLRQIVFTGGEPFFYFDDLKKYITAAKNAGKSISCMTNGYWAEDFNEGLKKLTELKNLGLGEIILSYDYYHSKYISPKAIHNAIMAANETKIETFLYVLNIKNHPMQEWMDQIQGIHKISNTLFRPCLLEGRAKKNLSSEECSRTITPDTQICQSQNKMLIKYDGTILPCIYPGLLNGGMEFGNYKETNYSKAKQKMDEDIILQTIRNDGFDPFIDFAKKERLIEIPEKITANCELCQLLFTKENILTFYEHFCKSIKKTS